MSGACDVNTLKLELENPRKWRRRIIVIEKHLTDIKHFTVFARTFTRKAKIRA